MADFMGERPYEDRSAAEAELAAARLQDYDVQDWADAIIVKQQGMHESRSTEKQILQDASWFGGPRHAPYELRRQELYGRPNSGPTITYTLQAFSPLSSNESVEYRYTAGQKMAEKRDGEGQNLGLSVEYYEEMLEHMRTAPVDPSGSLAAPSVINGILLAMEKHQDVQDFGRLRVLRMAVRAKLGRLGRAIIGRDRE